ncbi:MAG: hypothetical protein GPJ54_00185 [Candidatus Heimdallarchaeota archaeon]|nr:hypothetical protein [Candidatus Heimdallarchaeota archaeon]
MKQYAVLGLGMMGEAILYDVLTNDSESKVYGFELRDVRRRELEEKYRQFGDRISLHSLNLDLKIDFLHTDLFKILSDQGIDVVFGAIDYKYNGYLTRMCIETGSHFLDLGGNPEVVTYQRTLDDEARSGDVTIVPDCGLAPGMANILAASIMGEFDSLDTCIIRVGGLPLEPKTILNYQQVFSIRGLTNEYLEDAEVIRQGKYEKVESLTELEELDFELFDELPTLEAFQTAGGTSSLPLIFRGKINSLDYKTIRYKGHCQFIRFLKEFQLLSSESYQGTKINPREVVETYLEKNLPRGHPDLVLVKIVVTGIKKERNVRVVLEIQDKYDPATGFSSMARTTAYPIAIIGMMIAHSIINKRGVIAGESHVPYALFKEELNKRNIILKIIEKKI